jgi:hypothetical protein
MDRVPEGAQTDSMAPPPRRHAEWEDTMWWMVLGIVLILLIVWQVERQRGSKGDAAMDDRHLNRPDVRGGGTYDGGGVF